VFSLVELDKLGRSDLGIKPHVCQLDSDKVAEAQTAVHTSTVFLM
jgi:hypothetical protein